MYIYSSVLGNAEEFGRKVIAICGCEAQVWLQSSNSVKKVFLQHNGKHVISLCCLGLLICSEYALRKGRIFFCSTAESLRDDLHCLMHQLALKTEVKL